jgi:putative DNA methylase
VDRPHELSYSTHDINYYERELTKAFAEGRRILAPDGIGTIVFASKTTASWEAILQAVIDSGWIITGSWPIDTEREARVSAKGQARLSSSVHLVCRPRPDAEAAQNDDEYLKNAVVSSVGDWREVLGELPERIQAWFPRLVAEKIVGADAIFACLGPALEVFSRYSRVERASGEEVRLQEYLEHVWAAVARAALSNILESEDAAGFEEDARLTVIWFWVLRSGDDASNGKNSVGSQEQKMDEAVRRKAEAEADESDEVSTLTKTSGGIGGYVMEFDTARKLAQGLGADMHRLSQPGGIITIKGNLAALNRVRSREGSLIGHQLGLFPGDEIPGQPKTHSYRDPTATMRKVDARQPKLFNEQPAQPIDSDQPVLPGFGSTHDQQSLFTKLLDSGKTTLDRLHQAMLLFGHGQVSLLGLFLKESGAGSSPRFWRLAQALSALYLSGSDEKRWVDGVLARKKGLGY